MLRKNFAFLLLLLVISLPSFAGLDVYPSGDLKGQIRYTPEASWEALKLLNIDARIEGDNNNIKAVTTFEGLGDQFSWQPITTGFPTFNFQLKRVTLSTEAPLYFGGSPARLSFGDIAVNYSPLIVRMDDSIKVGNVLYNPMTRGVHLTGLQLPLEHTNLKADAFMIWESNNEASRMQRAVGRGVKLNTMLWGNELELVAIQRGDLREAGRTIERASASSLLGLIRESLTSKLKLEFGTDIETEIIGPNPRNTTREGYFQHLTYSQVLQEGLEGVFEYVVLPSEFAPLYRDRTPRFNEEGKATGWNPLDKMRFVFGLANSELYDQRQFLWGFNLRENNIALALKFDYRTLTSKENAPDGAYQSGIFTWRTPAGKYVFEGGAKLQRITLMGSNQTKSHDLGWQVKLGLICPFLETASNKMSISYRWYHEQVNPTVFGALHSIQIDNKIKSGLLAGANSFVGIKQERALSNSSKEGQLIYVCGLDYEMKQGIELEARWSSKNRSESPNNLYDYEGEEYIGYDNLFRVGVNTAF